MSNLLDPAYWFALSPSELAPRAKLAAAAFFAALVVVGFALRAASKSRAGSIYWAEGGKRAARFCFWMGPLGLLLVWFSHELVYFFGARFWFIAWGLAALAWLVRLVLFMKKEAPKRAAEFAEKARIGKYLPH